MYKKKEINVLSEKYLFNKEDLEYIKSIDLKHSKKNYLHIKAIMDKERQEEIQKTIDVTGLSEKTIKKLLNRYMHSEIRQVKIREKGEMIFPNFLDILKEKRNGEKYINNK